MSAVKLNIDYTFILRVRGWCGVRLNQLKQLIYTILDLSYRVLVSAALALSWRKAWGCYPEQNTVLKLYKVGGRSAGLMRGRGKYLFLGCGEVKNAIKCLFF